MYFVFEQKSKMKQKKKKITADNLTLAEKEFAMEVKQFLYINS